MDPGPAQAAALPGGTLNPHGPSSEQLFAEWLAGLGREERFAEMLRRYPEQASELQELHAIWERCRALLTHLSASQLEQRLADVLTPGEWSRLRRLLASLGDRNGGHEGWVRNPQGRRPDDHGPA